ncbi:hypothetical protein SASPL_140814 [Salvia splendens]|uniref:Uncharacterized protein n=1 Tax=Salvia splendens TaxID=180675 RepID=A0A8X8WQF8_SALSN|nr:hypothetical protein SASPL_140814 [Salvia splendens]
MDRLNHPDGEGWINPRITRVPAGSRGRGLISSASRRRGRISASSRGRGRILSNSRRRSRQSARDDEGLIHHLFSFICRSHIGELAETPAVPTSVKASPLTGGLAGGVDGNRTPVGCIFGGVGSASQTGGVPGGEGRASLTGGVAGGEDEASPTGCVSGGESRATPTGVLASGEGDASYEVTDSPVMSDEEFVRRYVITEADKEAWERNKVEAEREVKALFGENCLDPPALTHLQTVAFEQPKPAATLKRLHLFEKCILLSTSTSRCNLLGIPPSCTCLTGDSEFELCLLKCAARRNNADAPSNDELNHLVLEF